jgi:hypothetical protein
MVFKLDPVALVLDTFTLGCWSGYWRFTAGTGVWRCIVDGNATGSSTPVGYTSAWCKINILRTGNSSFTSTFTSGGATTTVSSSVNDPTYPTNVGFSWVSSGTATSILLDMDFIGGDFNSER